MHNFIRAAALIAMLFGVTLPSWAATPNEFYSSLLRRGVAAYETQRYDDAARSLRLAAFGFVESVEQYQTAHIYLALTYERMGSEERARDSARRVVAAQRIEARYMSVPLPQTVRAAFDALSVRVLTAPEIQLLRAAAPPRTTTTTEPPATTTTATAQPPAMTQPGTTTQQPATTQPTTTQPSTTQPSTTQPSTTPAQPRGATTTPTTPPPAPAQPRATPPQPQPQSSDSRPATPSPQTTQPQTAPGTTPAGPGLSPGETASRLIAAERALEASNLDEARRIYRELLTVATERATLIRIAEGFYRARDFHGALSAFQQLGALQRGEEPYRYYVAVSLYETGQYDRAKRELAAALPFIEVTPDVARYRAKIEGAL